MSFYFSNKLKDFLFKGWSPDTPAGFAGVCLAVIALTLVVELIKVFRTRWKFRVQGSAGESSSSEVDDGETSQTALMDSLSAAWKKRIGIHVGQSFIHIVEVVAAYVLMLAIMSYNGWIMISVALASGIGYLWLGQFRNLPVQYVKCKPNQTHTSSTDTEEIGEADVLTANDPSMQSQ